ncbi:MAG: HIT domain-containing protein [Dissulfurispiraceae bacterium]|jgi:ATP adenylyltransferase|nr:HIT domain-containing protein [Dissulfurispiraceae bacterium]
MRDKNDKGLKISWAPWRIEYIISEKPDECIFCIPKTPGDDKNSLILYRGKEVFVIMNKYPYNNGHLMVVPYQHASTLDELQPSTHAEMMSLTSYCTACLKEAFRPEGFNIGMNIGSAAGAGIKEHLHIHIVPRWAGDTNFMTVLGEVRVIPEHIIETYNKLYPLFNEKKMDIS